MKGNHITYMHFKNHENQRKNTHFFSRFDLESKTWTILNPLNVARSNASVVVFNGYIYAVGGKGQDAIKCGIVELFDRTNNNWVQVESMNWQREAFALFKSKEFLYAIGSVSHVEQYNTLKNIWTRVGFVR